MIIDFHTHIFSSDIIEKRENYIDDKIFGSLYTNDKAVIIDHTTLLEKMDESKIDYVIAMGFPWDKTEYIEKQNKYYGKVAEVTNGRIIPFGSVPLHNNENIEKRIRSIKDLGLSGIGEIAYYLEGMNNKNISILRNIFDSALKYSLPICLHVNEPVGHMYPGKYEPNLQLLYSIIQDYKDLTLILAHWGGGMFFYELMPEVKESFKNVYYDTAASPYLYNDAIYETAIKIIGSEKILFGSDYPLLGFKRYLTPIKNSITNEEDRKNIVGQNAKKLLKL